MQRAVSDYEIFKTWQHGPAATIRLFERVFGTVALYGPPAPDHLQQSIDYLSQKVDRLNAQITRLNEERSKLTYENVQLRRRNQELEAQISKDSHNSSRPPSSDPLARKRTKSLRQPSGKKPGGQPGHPGHTRPIVAKPARVIVHHPPQCQHCQSPLSTSQMVRHERRQVIDIVPATLRVTEHRGEVRRCSACGHESKGEFPQAVRAAVQYGPSVKARALYLQQYQLLPYGRTSEVLRDLFGCHLSPGTIANNIGECAAELVETELKIKKKIRRSSVVHADETGLRVAKRGQYVHVASTARLTHYAYDSRRGKAAMDEIGILPRYRGTCVHDAWWSYDYYTNCRHSLCGAHILRELTFFAELNAEQKAWAAPLKGILLEIKAAVEQRREAGGKHLASDEQAAFTERYNRLVQHGVEKNPPQGARAERHCAASEGKADQSDKAAAGAYQKQARNLVLRMERRREEVLRFMTDFSVPFDNNQAERDLRMIKLQQKVSGCLRTEEGARRFCRIRGYISTMRKQGKSVLKAIEEVCRGRPLSPTS